MQKTVLLTKELPKAQSCPKLRVHQAIVGVLVTCSQLPSLQSISVEQGPVETIFLPTLPNPCWLWQAGPGALQTSLGWLRGFAMGYETRCSQATCLVLAAQGGPAVAYMKRAGNFGSGGSVLSTSARLQAY